MLHQAPSVAQPSEPRSGGHRDAETVQPAAPPSRTPGGSKCSRQPVDVDDAPAETRPLAGLRGLHACPDLARTQQTCAHLTRAPLVIELLLNTRSGVGIASEGFPGGDVIAGSSSAHPRVPEFGVTTPGGASERGKSPAQRHHVPPRQGGRQRKSTVSTPTIGRLDSRLGTGEPPLVAFRRCGLPWSPGVHHGLPWPSGARRRRRKQIVGVGHRTGRWSRIRDWLEVGSFRRRGVGSWGVAPHRMGGATVAEIAAGRTRPDLRLAGRARGSRPRSCGPAHLIVYRQSNTRRNGRGPARRRRW